MPLRPAVAPAASKLAPVFLDGKRVVLHGDPKPRVSRVLRMAGLPTNTPVAPRGAERPLSPAAHLDRTEPPGRAIELHCLDAARDRTSRGPRPSARPLPATALATGAVEATRARASTTPEEREWSDEGRGVQPGIQDDAWRASKRA